MENNIKNKALSGVVWTAIQKYSSMAIHFISGIILARLLTPDNYGCIGMLAIFMTVSNSFIDGGFGSALIQKKKPTQADYSTIFYWNLIVGAAVYVLLFFLAPYVAEFYNIPILCKVLRVQAVVLIINAFTMVQSNQLRKKLNFKIISKVTILTALISLVITVCMAYKGFGVWALVAQNLITATVPATIYWFYIKWRPIWAFSWSSFKELFSFGSYVLLSNLLNNISTQIQGLLIGKFYDPTTMGYYSKAYSTETLASTSISSIITQVTYPLYAQVQDNVELLISIIKRITTTILYVTMPMMTILILITKPLFVLLYSDRWLASVPYFQVLCLAGIVNCLMAVNAQAVSAVGKSRVMFYGTILKRLVGISAIVSGLILYGMKGLLIGVLINTYFSYAVNISLVSKHIGYKWYTQIKDLMPIVLVSALSFIVSYAGVTYFNLPLYADGFMKLIVFVAVYLFLSYAFKLEAFRYTSDIIVEKVLSKLKRK